LRLGQGLEIEEMATAIEKNEAIIENIRRNIGEDYDRMLQLSVFMRSGYMKELNSMKENSLIVILKLPTSAFYGGVRV
jgi:hypothetical protein